MDHLSQPKPLLNQVFRRVFGRRFNVDLIDLRDLRDLEDRAENAVHDLIWRGIEPSETIAVLTEARRRWDRDVFQEFEDASWVDWTFDAETTKSLGAIIDDMLAAARDDARTSETAALRQAREQEIAAGKCPAASAAE